MRWEQAWRHLNLMWTKCPRLLLPHYVLEKMIVAQLMKTFSVFYGMKDSLHFDKSPTLDPTWASLNLVHTCNLWVVKVTFLQKIKQGSSAQFRIWRNEELLTSCVHVTLEAFRILRWAGIKGDQKYIQELYRKCRSLGRPSRRWKDNIKMYLRKEICEMEVTHNSVQWWCWNFRFCFQRVSPLNVQLVV
jgi:hypothetical protein